MANIRSRTEHRIECDGPSKWVISFERMGGNVVIGLHFGDKDYPANISTVPIADFANLSKALTS